MIPGYYCRQQDSGLNYIIQTLVFHRCWSIFDSLCRLVCLWISFHDWQRLFCRVKWATICGKLIHILKFRFLLSVRSPFVWFSSGTSKFYFGPNFLREFCKENDSSINRSEISGFFMSHLCWLFTWYFYFCI